MKAHNEDLSSRYSDQEKAKQVSWGKTKRKQNPPFTRTLVFLLSSVSPQEAITPVITTAFQNLGEQQALR